MYSSSKGRGRGRGGDDKVNKRERNKISAMKYRKRRKMQLETLEFKLSALNEVMGTQNKKITSLSTENKVRTQKRRRFVSYSTACEQMLKEQLDFLRNLVGMKMPTAPSVGPLVKEEPVSLALGPPSPHSLSAPFTHSHSAAAVSTFPSTAPFSLSSSFTGTAPSLSSPGPFPSASSNTFSGSFRPLVMLAMLACVLLCVFLPQEDNFAAQPAGRHLLWIPESSFSLTPLSSLPVFLLGCVSSAFMAVMASSKLNGRVSI